MNSNCDHMTNGPDRDPIAGKTAFLPFESSDLMLAGIRLLPAQLARAIGVSKQAVSTWVKSGRVILGSDGRVDPAQAIDRLLATGNPDRLRVKMLAPLQKEIATRNLRINELEVAVAVRDQRIGKLEDDLEFAELEDDDFYEKSVACFLQLFKQLQEQLTNSWELLHQAPPDAGRDAILAWLDYAMVLGAEQAGNFADYLAATDGAVGAGSESAEEGEK